MDPKWEKSRQYLVCPKFVQNGPSEELAIQLFKWQLLQATKAPVSASQGTGSANPMRQVAWWAADGSLREEVADWAKEGSVWLMGNLSLANLNIFLLFDKTFLISENKRNRKLSSFFPISVHNKIK
jgi:hypothetical protein